MELGEKATEEENPNVFGTFNGKPIVRVLSVNWHDKTATLEGSDGSKIMMTGIYLISVKECTHIWKEVPPDEEGFNLACSVEGCKAETIGRKEEINGLPNHSV